MKSEIVMKNSAVIRLLVVTSSLLPLPLMAQQISRTVLPVIEPKPPTITELDAHAKGSSDDYDRTRVYLTDFGTHRDIKFYVS